MELIHKYSLNGYNIVIDVNGGAVHVIDDVTYRVLDFYKENDLEDIVELLADEFETDKVREAYEEIKNLEEEGLLYSEDEYKFHPSFVNRQPVVKALCLNVAHDCNLKCKYCFAKQGDFGGKAELMPLEVGKKALDYLIANSGNRRNLEIDFFGKSSSLRANGLVSSSTTGSIDVNSKPRSAKCLTSSEKSRLSLVKVPLT